MGELNGITDGNEKYLRIRGEGGLDVVFVKDYRAQEQDGDEANQWRDEPREEEVPKVISNLTQHCDSAKKQRNEIGNNLSKEAMGDKDLRYALCEKKTDETFQRVKMSVS